MIFGAARRRPLQGDEMDYKEIAELIANSKKVTPSKVYVRGRFAESDFAGAGFQAFGEGPFWVLIGDFEAIRAWMEGRGVKGRIKDKYVDVRARYSALPLLDLTRIDARVEPGAIIRAGARIGKDCVIMMGAVINIGAVVGSRTMIDMNAVLGARATVGRSCHIGAGAVLAGVLEPPSRKPVVIRDHVLVGANAVVLEGVTVGKGSVVAAGAVVVRDVPPGVVVAGVPAEVLKPVSGIADQDKIRILDNLRGRRK
jgi:2,3,4,5-tetrahydropyridine-2,6-dicarboxylate N-acetyltransferase